MKSVAVFITGFAIAFLMFYSPESPRIGSTHVSSDLACTNEEVIGFAKSDPVPRHLSCIHIDNVKE